MPRATAPMPWATASQNATTPRLGAGLRAGGRLAALLVVEVLRGRVPVLVPLRVLVLRLDVLVLRDPGGEDVRVAMVTTLGDHHTSHRD